MGAKTKVVVKLISPREARERCEVHACRIRWFCVRCRVRCRKDLNYPPTAVGGIMRGRAGASDLLRFRPFLFETFSEREFDPGQDSFALRASPFALTPSPFALWLRNLRNLRILNPGKS